MKRAFLTFTGWLRLAFLLVFLFGPFGVLLAADLYVYVDPISGNNGTGAANAVAATAETTPYQTLAAAESGNRQNLTTLAGSIRFRLKGGTETTTTAITFSSTNWPGTTTTFRIVLEAVGTGVHDGLFATTNGYTLNNNSGAGVSALVTDGVYISVYDFRIIRAGTGQAIQNVNFAGGVFAERMLLRGSTGAALVDETILRNCVVVGTASSGVSVTGSSGGVFEHNTIIGNHATNAALNTTGGTNNAFRWNYAHNRGAGAAYGGSSWAGSTRNKNASSDTSGDASYQSISYSTSSGAYFTDITNGSENLRIGASSVLKDAATDSSVTIDILGASRSTPDIGAFEYIAAGGSSTSARRPFWMQ